MEVRDERYMKIKDQLSKFEKKKEFNTCLDYTKVSYLLDKAAMKIRDIQTKSKIGQYKMQGDKGFIN